jgi:hypothetical protein
MFHQTADPQRVTYPEEPVVLLSQVNAAVGALSRTRTHQHQYIGVGGSGWKRERERENSKKKSGWGFRMIGRTYHLLEMRKAEDGVVDFDRWAFGCYVGHDLGGKKKCRCRRNCGWRGRESMNTMSR